MEMCICMRLVLCLLSKMFLRLNIVFSQSAHRCMPEKEIIMPVYFVTFLYSTLVATIDDRFIDRFGWRQKTEQLANLKIQGQFFLYPHYRVLIYI